MTEDDRLWAYIESHPKIVPAATRAAGLTPQQPLWAEELSFGRECFFRFLRAEGLPQVMTPAAERRLNSRIINRIAGRITSDLKHQWHQADVIEQAHRDPTNPVVKSERTEATFVQQTEDSDLWERFKIEAHLSVRQKNILDLLDQEASETKIARELHIARQTVHKEILALQADYFPFADVHHLRYPTNVARVPPPRHDK